MGGIEGSVSYPFLNAERIILRDIMAVGAFLESILEEVHPEVVTVWAELERIAPRSVFLKRPPQHSTTNSAHYTLKLQGCGI